MYAFELPVINTHAAYIAFEMYNKCNVKFIQAILFSLSTASS